MSIIDVQLGAGWGLVVNRPIRQDDRELASSLDAGLVSIGRASAGRGCAGLRRLFHHHKVEAILVRPDRVVFAAGRTAQDIERRIAAFAALSGEGLIGRRGP